jgi:hypothetical protein
MGIQGDPVVYGDTGPRGVVEQQHALKMVSVIIATDGEDHLPFATPQRSRALSPFAP